MNNFVTWIVFTLIISSFKDTLGFIDPNKPRRCETERVKRMLGYVCTNLNLQDIPTYLKESTEVLDISQNRIKDLKRNSFDKLRELKYLYLQENVLRSIEEDTFVQLVDLEAIDLSGNGLTHIPAELFSLPRLRNLYLADNFFKTFDNIPKTIIAPLQKLSLANNRLDEIPKEFSILPELVHLNLSSNTLKDLKPEQFSPFCHLREVNISNSNMSPCDCEKIRRFLVYKRDVNIFLFYCDANPADCLRRGHDFNVSVVETSDFDKCLTIRKQTIEHEQAQMTWAIVGVSVLGFLFFFISCLYCIHKRNVRQMRNKTINNTGVKPKIVVQSNEPGDETTTNSPDKLLIRKTNV